MSNNSGKRVIAMPTLAENRRITAAAKADPDAQPLTAKQLAEMIPLRAAVRARSRPEGVKELVPIGYSREVLAYFRSTGPGWQARMNAVLLDHVRGRCGPKGGAVGGHQERKPAKRRARG